MVSKNNIAKRHTLRKTPRCIAALSAILICLSCLVLYTSCSISYKFNGSSIDYTKIQSIQIGNFPIRSTYVWAPMQAIFQNKLTDLYANQTRLKQVKRNGDLVLEGEIVGFDVTEVSPPNDNNDITSMYAAQLMLSRTHPNLVKKLFELEEIEFLI